MIDEKMALRPESGEKSRECARCGTCCRKEGPAFHRRDKGLIESGAIPLKNIFTIRKGELARDNVRGELIPVSSDILKIKGREGSWTCMFFVEEGSACAIYESRPLECRVLKCWDTREFRDIYDADRLTRKDLLADIEGTWEIIEDHEARCSHVEIRRLADAVRAGNEEQAEALRHILRYDFHIRDLMTSKAKMDPGIMDFLLGRPLAETIHTLGIELKLGGEPKRK